MSDLAMRLTGVYSECQERVRDAFIDAQNEAAEIGQRYSAELFAASGGDDALERVRQAGLRYSHEVARVHHHYAAAVREQQRTWTAAVQQVQSEVADAAFENFLESLRALGFAGEQEEGPAPPSEESARPATKPGWPTTKQPETPE